jgi:hypothetical protein
MFCHLDGHRTFDTCTAEGYNILEKKERVDKEDEGEE